jgi:dolichol-phosphate mannosyltransferase
VTAIALSSKPASRKVVANGSAPECRLPLDVPRLLVIPAYNEAENLPRLIADLESRPTLFPPGSRVIVVDDGSEDATPGLVEGYRGPLPIQLIRLGQNEGPGAAFRAGFKAALDHCPPDALVVTLEADTTSDLDALPTMIERACAGAELVIASWTMVNVSRKRRLLSAGAAFVVRHALGIDARTVSSFFRVYRASALRAGFARYGDRFICEPGFACKAEILAKLAGLRMHIEEVPVDLDSAKRIGESKMPIVKTAFAYWRMLARQIVARGIEA